MIMNIFFMNRYGHYYVKTETCICACFGHLLWWVCCFVVVAMMIAGFISDG